LVVNQIVVGLFILLSDHSFHPCVDLLELVIFLKVGRVVLTKVKISELIVLSGVVGVAKEVEYMTQFLSNVSQHLGRVPVSVSVGLPSGLLGLVGLSCFFREGSELFYSAACVSALDVI